MADIDSIRFDDVSFEGEHGRVGVTLFMPSARQLGLQGAPELIVLYSAGWGEGKGATEAACQALARAANVMTVAVNYPKKSLAVHEIVPFRTEVLCEVITTLREHTYYDHYDIIVCGYSRGTAPARLAAIEKHDDVCGVCLVAPTWFKENVKPLELAQKGLAESARGVRRGSWMDRLGLVGATARLAQELVTHPLALRKDVSAIAEDGAADVAALLATGINVSVVAGVDDEVCGIEGIRHVLEEVGHVDNVSFREVDSDHFSYFLQPTPLKAVAEQIQALASSE